MPLQIPPVQHVEPPPQPEIEVHEIHSDLEEEAGPSTCPINILTSMTSSIPGTHLSENIFDSLFPQYSFSKLNLKSILEDTTRDPSVLEEVPNLTPLSSPSISLTSHTSHTTPTSSHIQFSQI